MSHGRSACQGVTDSLQKPDESRPHPSQQIPDRAFVFSNHPVVTRAFQFPTPPVIRAFDVMTRTIASGAPSCAFVAFPRFGKTWAIAYSKERLREVFPSIPIASFHAHHEIRSTESSFFANLLRQNGYSTSSAYSRDYPAREGLSRALWVLAQTHHSKTLVLLGDEMQCLGQNQYSWLIDLTNDLHAQGVRVISILFGQPELASLRTVLRETHRGDILGRFMSRVYSFDGISSARELRQVMACYDDREHGEYPKESGWCFTQFFMPQAYEQGWRLSSNAELCWERFNVFAHKRLKAPTTTKLSIGMEWVAGALQYALTYFGDMDRRHFSISESQWNEAIENSGFPDSLGLTYHPEWSPLV